MIRKSYELGLGMVGLELSRLEINMRWLLLYILLDDELLCLALRDRAGLDARFWLLLFRVFGVSWRHWRPLRTIFLRLNERITLDTCAFEFVSLRMLENLYMFFLDGLVYSLEILPSYNVMPAICCIFDWVHWQQKLSLFVWVLWFPNTHIMKRDWRKTLLLLRLTGFGKGRVGAEARPLDKLENQFPCGLLWRLEVIPGEVRALRALLDKPVQLSMRQVDHLTVCGEVLHVPEYLNGTLCLLQNLMLVEIVVDLCQPKSDTPAKLFSRHEHLFILW